jgi:beta-lactamase superfamily II metal-dependent hydrolase
MGDVRVHFLDVGCGNMTLVVFPNGVTYLYDCNVTDDNEDAVLAYLSTAMGNRTSLDAFICSHRDADHMRGLRKVHDLYPISEIRDSGVPGTTTDSSEYEDYMAMRRMVRRHTIEARTKLEVGDATVRYMNAAYDDFTDANDQSIVMKIEYGNSSVLLAGDTSFRPWKEKILLFYPDEKLRADILLGSHHGSLTFFDDPSDNQYYYMAHIEKISPAMTLLSVGPNSFGLPDDKAVELYTKRSRGSDKGNKVYRTDEQGSMRLVLKGEGGWRLEIHQ